MNYILTISSTKGHVKQMQISPEQIEFAYNTTLVQDPKKDYDSVVPVSSLVSYKDYIKPLQVSLDKKINQCHIIETLYNAICANAGIKKEGLSQIVLDWK